MIFLCQKVKYAQYTTRITATLRLLWGIFCGKNPVFKYWHYLYCRKGTRLSLHEDAPGLTVRCITEKPKDMDLNDQWVKNLSCVVTYSTNTFYYCKRKLNSLVLLRIYSIYFQSIFKWKSVERRSSENSQKPLFLSWDFQPRRVQRHPKTQVSFKRL